MMAPKRKNSRFNALLNYKLWLSSVSGEGIISEETYGLLQGVLEKGSLSAAASKLGISYRKAWGDLKKAEELLGYELTEKKRGGREGGHSRLTPGAMKLLEAYKALREKLDDAVEEAYAGFKKSRDAGKPEKT
jgi:molybdate transport system regulatory protein